MTKFILSITILISFCIAKAQNDTINTLEYKPGFKFKEGIYLNFEQFKTNNPISKARIVSQTDNNRFDFFDIVLQEKKITIYDNTGNITEIETSKIWGFCNRSVIYINFNDEFNRIPILGNISHFVANYSYTEYDPYSPGYNPYGTYYPPSTKTELRQYLLDFNSGKIYDFSYKTVEILLMNDSQLYDQFVELSKRKKNKQKFIFIREFNKKNPIYFPK